MDESPGLENAQSTSLLWYCSRCTKLILPPGAAGVVVDDGGRFCEACAPFEIQASTVIARMPASKPSTPPTRSVSVRAGAFAASAAPQTATGSKTIWLVGSAAAIGLALLGIFHFTSHPPAKIAEPKRQPLPEAPV